MKKLFLFLIFVFVWSALLWLGVRYALRFVASMETVSHEPAIAFLDVGQGDATLITFSDGYQILVDCARDARVLEALGRVLPFYDKTIERMVVTHPDADHFGGCADVLQRFDVHEVVLTGRQKDTALYDGFMEMVRGTETPVHIIAGFEQWQIASSTVHILFPDQDISAYSDFSANDTSIVMKVVHGDQSVLLTGDAEEALENHLIDVYGTQLDVDVLKAGHHGAPNASGSDFLSVVTPSSTVISSGTGNAYGHPSLRVLRRLERAASQIWRTDTQGDILLLLDTGIITSSYASHP